ncbi:UDP-glucose--hexose-1-phosphate uridylyltransferase [Metabacillus sp. GX 13764]|uniref:UDP-glucose--hexose-1-phosphate uridylyltransferase n=1 Tax=Metabacillus kandeliae TaxID=2900151 RepID=UPI001E63B122|nr:UDP-glucose--hexose-1-phosphate uridylyltransferase [Metabacillus kandeliae]MCD7035044.1 UDP-glucose--hexose-1-phosphate uridylyltransferase [Metabacillus kandeliae]
MTIYQQLEELVQYGLDKGLITEWDKDLARNKLLEALHLDDADEQYKAGQKHETPVAILEQILDWAAENGLLEENTVTYRDLLDTKLMGCLTPSQTEVIRSFRETAYNHSIKQATNHFYQFSQDVHYIRTDRIAKNQHWYADTEYGDLEITINLSKPEKDPIAIAAARNLKESSYPKCLLCKENVGFKGRVNHPARQNHRIIPVTLNQERWYLQYSPYVYYNEHSIILAEEHRPMKISRDTFISLLDFTEEFPHYFLGSNADLPIVGGSILSHDHFQGGHHEFPMAKAEIETEFSFTSFPGVKAGIVKWPMSVIRLNSRKKSDLVELAEHILTTWRNYSDPEAGIHAYSGEEPHNTITPIARRRGNLYELDLVLRNNRTSDEHPMGIFHPHQEVHHIKKENIGLIEVMGLAVLPGRLTEEMLELSEVLPSEAAEEAIKSNLVIEKHLAWALTIKEEHPELNEENAYSIIQKELGNVFAIILEHAGVYKRNDAGREAFSRFIEEITA